PHSQDADLHDGRDKDDQEERHGDRGSIAAVLLIECLLVHVQEDHPGPIERSSEREKVDLVEYLPLGNELEHEHERGDRPEQGPCDEPKERETSSCAVQGG